MILYGILCGLFMILYGILCGLFMILYGILCGLFMISVSPTLFLHLLFWLVPVLQAEACNTGTTETQPHQVSNTQRTENKTTDVVIQQHSRKLLMMDILISEACWVHKKWNEIAGDIKLVFYSSTIIRIIRIIKSALDEMGHGSCDTHGGEQKVLVGNLKERVRLEALALDGKKIFICTSQRQRFYWSGLD